MYPPKRFKKKEVEDFYEQPDGTMATFGLFKLGLDDLIGHALVMYCIKVTWLI